MLSIKLCKKDPIITELRNTYKANIVKIPETRIQPLTTIAKKNQKIQFWGNLIDLLDDSSIPEITKDVSDMAEVSGRKTQSVESDIGIDILQGFLGGFGIQSGKLALNLKSTKEISFRFDGAKRFYIAPSRLGSLITNKKLHSTNPATQMFLNQEAELYIIDSIIASNNFTVSVEKVKNNNFKLDLPAIKSDIANLNSNIKVSSSTGLDISFQGEKIPYLCLYCF